MILWVECWPEQLKHLKSRQQDPKPLAAVLWGNIVSKKRLNQPVITVMASVD